MKNTVAKQRVKKMNGDCFNNKFRMKPEFHGVTLWSYFYYPSREKVMTKSHFTFTQKFTTRCARCGKAGIGLQLTEEMICHRDVGKRCDFKTSDEC